MPLSSAATGCTPLGVLLDWGFRGRQRLLGRRLNRWPTRLPQREKPTACSDLELHILELENGLRRAVGPHSFRFSQATVF